MGHCLYVDYVFLCEREGVNIPYVRAYLIYLSINGILDSFFLDTCTVHDSLYWWYWARLRLEGLINGFLYRNPGTFVSFVRVLGVFVGDSARGDSGSWLKSGMTLGLLILIDFKLKLNLERFFMSCRADFFLCQAFLQCRSNSMDNLVKSTHAFSGAINIWSIVHDFCFIGSEAGGYFLSFQHTNFALNCSCCFHTTDPISLPDNCWHRYFFQYFSYFVYVVDLSTVVWKLFWTCVGTVISSAAPPVWSKLFLPRLNYFPYIVYMFLCSIRYC